MLGVGHAIATGIMQGAAYHSISVLVPTISTTDLATYFSMGCSSVDGTTQQQQSLWGGVMPSCLLLLCNAVLS